ncbi:MAG TPA: tRNA uridine-5-carboxymethylaminomethyl(34) synthesis enzyme MnmG [Phycisphaerae bacterium]|nr:tRNA uridine-5-carboxymethylaminomethyl(34) synthesis enzyme MnmG [Phycisphaerae bacterium]HPS52253.1 tRNA uridine-5-carboxymethylaminomethyl(34) synthesis enzyme MnmG [Phycisphaerae bacterium]
MEFDIVIVGGGHAGIEAVWAAARMGANAALVTMYKNTIGQMSCNPAIGGIGKGQIVREIDALGGLMGLAADANGIQFRMLNASKGPAVQGPRCQADRHAYSGWMQEKLLTTPGIMILEGMAIRICTSGGKVCGLTYRPVNADADVTLKCSAVIVTAGTFLAGIMHRGPEKWAGGRINEPAANELSESLRNCGLTLGRLKTGTCPRLAAETVDYSRCTRQDGDAVPSPFSFMNRQLDVEQIPCWLTATNEKIHQAIRDNFHRAPMYTGQITSVGPRYCPSFETKVQRFADKTSHQVFLEPEGRNTNWIYCNGITTSMPRDVQDFMVANIPGLENAKILQYGYAIEYDFAQPTQLFSTLETKCMQGLYLAGQLNGTTGYEEAGALGMMAAINAALKLQNRAPLILTRQQAYMGVMIDDLITKGVTEPYRMFTSRAEHRLTLRYDNADRRLTPVGCDIGTVDTERHKVFEEKSRNCSAAENIMHTTRIEGKTLWELMRRPGAKIDLLINEAGESGKPLQELQNLDAQAVNTIAIDAAYEGYTVKQEQYNARFKDLDAKKLPAGFDYFSVKQLRWEAKEKLSKIQPANLGQALRVSGITPADITVLAISMADSHNSGS